MHAARGTAQPYSAATRGSARANGAGAGTVAGRAAPVGPLIVSDAVARAVAARAPSRTVLLGDLVWAHGIARKAGASLPAQRCRAVGRAPRPVWVRMRIRRVLNDLLGRGTTVAASLGEGYG